jgi:Na+-driven multidrug efflux pump
MTALLISMVSAGVVTAVGEKVCNSLGQNDIANYIRVGGVSLTGAVAIGAVVSLIGKVKSAFGG